MGNTTTLIYDAQTYSERAYREDCYEDGLFGETGELLPECEGKFFVLVWETTTTQHLTDATVHGPYDHAEAQETNRLLVG